MRIVYHRFDRLLVVRRYRLGDREAVIRERVGGAAHRRGHPGGGCCAEIGLGWSVPRPVCAAGAGGVRVHGAKAQGRRRQPAERDVSTCGRLALATTWARADRPVTGGPAKPLSRLRHAITLGDEEEHSMAHHYAIRTFDETAPVVRGGATAAYESAGKTLEHDIPARLAADPAHRDRPEDRTRRGNRVVRRAAPGGLNRRRRPRRSVTGAGGEAARRAQRGGWPLERDGHGHEHVERGPLQEPADPPASGSAHVSSA